MSEDRRSLPSLDLLRGFDAAERSEVKEFAAWLMRQAKQEARYRGNLLK